VPQTIRGKLVYLSNPPGSLEIIYEINRRFLADVRRCDPGDDARVARVSLIEEQPTRRVCMAQLAETVRFQDVRESVGTVAKT
jgi:hypothetical protein